MDILKNKILFQLPEKDTNIHAYYVLWSGGCDSTLLLFKLLQQYGPDKVIALTHKHPWYNSKKWESEKNIRELFKTKMKKRYDWEFKHIEFTHEVSRHAYPSNTGGLNQQISWLDTISPYIHSNSILFSGYIAGDHYWYNHTQIQEIFKLKMEVLNRENVQLLTPMKAISKSEIIYMLYIHNLYKLTWFCETPIDPNTLCKECNQCKQHRTAMFELMEDNFVDESVRKWAKRKLKKLHKVSNEEDEKEDPVTDGKPKQEA